MLLYYFAKVNIPPSHAVIVKCDDLIAPANGDVNQPGNSVGTVASYTCNDGFQLIGDKTRTCQKDGEWSGADPVCKCEHSFHSLKTLTGCSTLYK